MNDATIIQASLRDLTTLLSLITDYHAWEEIPDPPNLVEAIEFLLAADHPGGFWIAWDGDRPVAYVAVTLRFSLAAGGDVLVIDELFVLEAARNHGLGRRLIDTTHAYGAAIGCRELLLEVANSNRTAQAFYAALGFTPRLRRCWERPILPMAAVASVGRYPPNTAVMLP
ncbi:MAG: GNAT family N-acetyltransferase [Candidatus Sericytochromatia bacterium]|nr:GNAT family N-acetyltransferase [Candidatus Sericytochromatia bacterium]